jgi:hypothetical protein
VPRWIWFACVVGIIAFVAVYGPWAQPSAQVRTIVAGLRTSSVYVQAGAPSLIDPAHARQVIGNRPIVVVLLNRDPLPASGDSDPRETLCQQIAKEVTNDYIWVYGADKSGKYKGNNCYGTNFPQPTKPGVSMDDFDTTLNIAAQLSAQFRTSDTNLNPEIEEFVLTFDSTAADDYGAVPTRGAIPDTLAVRQIVLACVGMIAGTVTLFLLLRTLGTALRRRGAAGVARARRRAALTAELNRVADAVINPRPTTSRADAERQAEAAKQYVLALDELEHAHTDAELTKAESEIKVLTEAVR